MKLIKIYVCQEQRSKTGSSFPILCEFSIDSDLNNKDYVHNFFNGLCSPDEISIDKQEHNCLVSFKNSNLQIQAFLALSNLATNIQCFNHFLDRKPHLEEIFKTPVQSPMPSPNISVKEGNKLKYLH